MFYRKQQTIHRPSPDKILSPLPPTEVQPLCGVLRFRQAPRNWTSHSSLSAPIGKSDAVGKSVTRISTKKLADEAGRCRERFHRPHHVAHKRGDVYVGFSSGNNRSSKDGRLVGSS